MSSKPWQASLRQALKSRPRSDRPARVAVVGVGVELCGDDAAGVALAQTLRRRSCDGDTLLVIDAGPALENTGGLLRRFGPDLVLVVDAAQMDEPPGAVRWLRWQDTAGLSASTHTLPIHMFAAYLTQELGCEVALLGIQPAQNAFDTPLSPQVARAVEATADALIECVSPATAPAASRSSA